MNALTFFQSNPQLGIGFIAALLLSAMVFPDKGVQGWQRWGQFALSPIVFVITIGNVFQYDPTDSHAIINTGMRWLLQVLVVGGVGFLIGAGGYKLCEGGAAVANVAASVARDGVTHAKDRAARLETRTCPFCAETIKAQAVVCRHCERDVGHPDSVGADEEKLDSVITEIQARYPQFVADHPERNPDLEDEAILRMRGYMTQGMDRGDALKLAIFDMERMGAFQDRKPPKR